MFPPTDQALDDPNGLLAIGGELSPSTLIEAYSRGIFPWYSTGQPIMWWTPEPRLVISLDDFHLSKRDRRALRSRSIRTTINRCFATVIEHCASISRPGQPGTWITDDMQIAYCDLHRLGYAHSVEAWEDDVLIGGIYGIALRPLFFGESMFSLRTGGSKFAIAALVDHLKQLAYVAIDGQVESPHLYRLGGKAIARSQFEALLTNIDRQPDPRWPLP